MKTIWTKGLESDAKKELTLSFNSSGVLRERLTQLIKEKIATSEKLSYAGDGYECPNWAYKQADLAGYKRALHDVERLL